MALNIKNRDTDRMARELSRITGKSLTEVVHAAIAQRLEEERRKQGVTERVARVMDIVRRCNPAGPGVAPDHDALLYDERGLPK